MPEIAAWLNELGLAQYEVLFEREKITLDVLPHLNDAHLKDLGIPLGHRLRILRACQSLSATASGIGPAASGGQLAGWVDKRQLTVMFCDLTDSVGLTRRFGSEQFRHFLNDYRDTCSLPLRRFGGFTARYVGDAILVYFGYPTAHENDAERAISAALEILSGISELAERYREYGRPDIAVRIGIATGEVVVGDSISNETKELAAVTGDAPNLAARLQSQALPGTISIDPATRQLAGDQFEYQFLGEEAIKGFDAPIPIWRVVEERLFTRFEARNRSAGRLLGRSGQLSQLCQQWMLAAGGRGQIALISGPAGIGKSCLADALRAHAIVEARKYHRLSPITIGVQCSQFHSNTPLFPVSKAIGRLARLERADSTREQQDKLRILLQQTYVPDVKSAMPLIADLMAIDGASEASEIDLDPRARRHKQMAVLRDWVDSAAMHRPVLLVFEDLQWIDPTSWELFVALAKGGQGSALMVVGTLRTREPSPSGPATLQTELINQLGEGAALATYGIRELDYRDVRQLVSDIAMPVSVPVSVLDDILEKADGNPLFAEELTRAWLSRRQASLESGARKEDQSRFLVPASLSGALLTQIDQLGPTKQIALRAAVIGIEFTYNHLTSILPDEDFKVEPTLKMLERIGLIRPVTNAGERTFRFSHALVQNAAYGSLLDSHRRDIHRDIALVLEKERSAGLDVPLEMIARHHSNNHAPLQAIQLWQEAAQQAIATSAHTEAARLLDEALDLLKSLPLSEQPVQLELELTASSAAALRSVHGYAAPLVEERYLRAQSLAQQADVPQLLFQVNWGLFQCYLVKSDFVRAEELVAELVLTSERLDNRARADALLASGMVSLGQCDIDNAIRYLERAASLTDPIVDPPNLLTHGQNPGIFIRSNLAHAHAFKGFTRRAQDIMFDNLTIAENRQTGSAHLYTYINSLAFASRVFLLLRNAAAVMDTSLKLQSLAQEHHYAYYEAIAECQIGWAHAEKGDLKEGIAKMRSGIAALERTGTKLAARGFVIHLAEFLARAGQHEEANQALAQAADDPGTAISLWSTEIDRIKGAMKLQVAGPDDAESNLRSSFNRARALGAGTLSLRSAFDLAQLLHESGRSREASALLETAIGELPEIADTPDLLRARSLILAIRKGDDNGKFYN